MSKFNTLSVSCVAASVLCLSLTTARADGMDKAAGSMKDAMPAAQDAREFKFSWNLGVTNDYVFRGFSQNQRKPSVEGGLDITYGTFYAGLWAANVNFTPATDFNGFAVKAPVELDLYMGFKPVLKSASGDYNFDFGVIGYTYPGQNSGSATLTYGELKAGVNHDIWKDGNLSQTFFYSPAYSLATGTAFTSETTFTQTLAAHGKWVPSVSGTYGHQWGNRLAFQTLIGNGSKEYGYFNAGTTFTYDSKLSLDLRYWGTDLKNNNAAGGFANDFCGGPSLQCGNRFAATLKYTY